MSGAVPPGLRSSPSPHRVRRQPSPRLLWAYPPAANDMSNRGLGPRTSHPARLRTCPGAGGCPGIPQSRSTSAVHPSRTPTCSRRRRRRRHAHRPVRCPDLGGHLVGHRDPDVPRTGHPEPGGRRHRHDRRSRPPLRTLGPSSASNASTPRPPSRSTSPSSSRPTRSTRRTPTGCTRPIVDGTSTWQNRVGEPVITGGPTSGIALTLTAVPPTPPASITGTIVAPAETRVRSSRGGSSPRSSRSRPARSWPVRSGRSPTRRTSRSRSATTRHSSTRRPTYVVKGGIIDGPAVWQNRAASRRSRAGSRSRPTSTPGRPGSRPICRSPRRSRPRSRAGRRPPTAAPTAAPSATAAATATPARRPRSRPRRTDRAPPPAPTATPTPTRRRRHRDPDPDRRPDRPDTGSERRQPCTVDRPVADADQPV